MPSAARRVAAAVSGALCLASGADAASRCEKQKRFGLVLHGGFVAEADDVGARQFALLREQAQWGRSRLEQGAPALDVVVATIAAMEDSGLLDAGKGSIVNTAGFTETDASLMEGHSGRSGAVAAMQRLKNPIRAARLVMERTPHVLFAGTTGEQTLIELGAVPVKDPASYFQPAPTGRPPPERAHGTVGAAVLDRCGHLAAGTSTGGWPGKLPGRVGDSPIVGASTFANERVALSATGRGELFIRRGATRDIAARVEYRGQPLQAAADHVVKTLIGAEDGAAGAIIAIDRDAKIVMSSNGYGVLHAFATDAGELTVGARLGSAAADDGLDTIP